MVDMQAAIFSFQNSNKYWENAQTFKPERFLAQSSKSERAPTLPAFCAFGDVSVPQCAIRNASIY
jgi:cytochrome P450